MPQHDLPDGHEADGNLIDFSKYFRQRVGQSGQDNDAPEPAASDLEVYRRAEYGDGKPPRLSWYDALWIGPFLAVAWMVWALVRH